MIIVILAAYAARSVALAGFGLDSLIEIFAFVVVVWQLMGVHLKRGALSLKRKPVQLAGASAIILLGPVILLSLSGTLSFLIERRTHTLPTSHLPATVNIPSLLSTVPVPQQDGLTCLTDATWSPDSKRLAVLGYSQDCPQGPDSYEPGLVNVYDAHAVKLLAQVRPDGAILSALRKQFSGARERPVIIYDSVLWSPDGRQMALPFVAHFWPDQAAPAFAGMLLMSEDGRQTVFLWQEPEVESELEASYLVWDLERGVPAVVKYGYGSAPSSFFTVNIPPALTYHWEPNGMRKVAHVVKTEKSAKLRATFLLYK